MPKAVAQAFQGFADAKGAFFARLAKNQNKDWFVAHKAEYEAGWVLPMESLFAEVKVKLDAAYPHVDLGNAKVMRIYRDVRFSKDKTPYKDHIAGGLALKVGAGSMMGSPSALYLSIGAKESFAGAGMYMLDPPQLAKYRAAALDPKRGAELGKLVRALEKKGHRMTAGETLKRVPKGVPPEHPFAHLLSMKGLVTVYPEFPRAKLTSRAFLDWVVKASRDAAPLVEWLTFATS